MLARLLLCACFLVASALAIAQEQALIRVLEANSSKLSFICITYENGQSETIEMEEYSAWTREALGGALKNNQKILLDVLKRMREQGFEVVHMATTGDGTIVTQLILEKRP